MTAMTTTATPSDVMMLEEALRHYPLEDALRYALSDALQEPDMTPVQSKRRACDVRGEGLARLIAGDKALARKARRELRRTAGRHPSLAARLRRAVICVRRDRFPPAFLPWHDTSRWRMKIFDESTWSKDRVEVGALSLLGLLRRLVKPPTRRTGRK